MWLTFLAAVIICACVLYAPGFFLLRGLNVTKLASALLAPLLSLLLIPVVGIVLQKAHVTCSGMVFSLVVLAISLGVFAIARTGRALSSHANRSVGKYGLTNKDELLDNIDSRNLLKTMALYVGVSLVLALIVFLLPIDGAASFSRNDDTAFHLNVIRTFLDTGTFSTLSVSAYLDQGAGGVFYPAAWHVLTALVASFIGENVIVAANATLVTLVVLVFPLGMSLFMTRLFPHNKACVAAGSLVVLAFGAFPWGFVVWGQLLPNMTAFILVPFAFVALIECLNAKGVSARVRFASVIFGGLIAIALAQPNAAFTFGVWALPYCVSRVFYLPGQSTAGVTRKRLVLAISLIVCACIVWAGFYLAPFMQPIVQNTWSASLSPLEAIGCGVLFMFTVRGGVQPFLSLAVLVGFIVTLRDRRYLWLSVSFLFALGIYLVDASTDGVLKQILSGFWYTDIYRTGAMTALFAMPLAALGLSFIVKGFSNLFTRVRDTQGNHLRATLLPWGLTIALLTACQFFPAHVKLSEKIDIHTGLIEVRNEVSSRYSWDSVLTSEEDAFISKSLATIPKDSLIINFPNDGTCWSYGVEGANVYFRRCKTEGVGTDEQSTILRTQLCNIASSEEVANVVRDVGARYLLLLDDSKSDERSVTNQRYKAENWTGIESITEDTPGFTVLLHEGDNYLYEISGA